MNATEPLRAAIAVFPGADDLDVFGPLEVLADAGLAAPLELALLSVGEPEPLRTSHGATLVPDGRLSAAGALDLIVVPGGGWNDRAADGAYAEAQRGELGALLSVRHAAGTTIASVCTGAGILAAAGLLDGRPASTHHAARADVAAYGAQIVDARVVDDGEILTAGGVTAGIDLALHLVERYFRAGLADRIAEQIEYERRGPLVLGPGPRVRAG